MASLMTDIDTGDLYEGGKASKRKRGFDDYDSDDDGGPRRNKDPDAYNPSMAKMRCDMIRSELNKRRSGNVNSPAGKQTPYMTDEDKQRLANTRLKDPHNSNISNLTLKSRENWFNKMCQVMQENFNLFSNDPANSEQAKLDLCVRFEYEILEKAKNLSIYQAKCMTKYKEIRNMTAEKKSFLEDFLSKGGTLEPIDDDHIVSDLLLDGGGKKAAFNNLKISAGFASASSLMQSSPGQKQSAFKVPKFEAKSVFDELNTKENEINKKPTVPYEDQLKDVKVKKVEVKSEAERMREARLAKFQTIKSEPESKPKLEVKAEPDTKTSLDVIKKEPESKLNLSVKNEEESKLNLEVKKEPEANVRPIGLAKISSLVVIELTPFYKANKFANKVNNFCYINFYF